MQDKEALNAKRRARYAANKENILARNGRWRAANKEKVKLSKKAFYEANKERVKAKSNAWYEVNKEKANVRNRSWYAANRDRMNAYDKARAKTEERKMQKKAGRDRDTNTRLKREFGVDLVWFNRQCDVQEFTCAICKNVLEDKVTGKGRTLHIDHCHETRQVRELLCDNCNRGLGLFKDSPERLLKAAAYLRKHQLRAIQQARREYFAPVNPRAS